MHKDPELEEGWKIVLADEFSKEYMDFIRTYLKKEIDTGTQIYPPAKKIFRAFNLTPFDKVKVVILGQDPYHGMGQANGLCFSVNRGIPLPPSLRNIYKELAEDMGIPIPVSGDLAGWADEGVLLLNTVLTVKRGKAGSHRMLNWDKFTDVAIEQLSKRRHNLVFILWGTYAQTKRYLIDQNRHLILASPHPSPLSSYRGFFGSKPFSKANVYLRKNGIEPIDWEVTGGLDQGL